MAPCAKGLRASSTTLRSLLSPLTAFRLFLYALPPTCSTTAPTTPTKATAGRLDALSELIDASRNAVRTTEECDDNFERPLSGAFRAHSRSTAHQGAIAPRFLPRYPPGESDQRAWVIATLPKFATRYSRGREPYMSQGSPQHGIY